MMDELLPCPFCGLEPERFGKDWLVLYQNLAYCKCPCGVAMGPRKTLEEANEDWNRRATPRRPPPNPRT